MANDFSSNFACRLEAYRSARACEIRSTRDDDAFEHWEEAVDCLFWTMARTPAPTRDDLIAKGEAILREYGETGEVRSDLFVLVLDDVRGMKN